MTARKKLGELLLEAGVIDQQRLDAALAEQQRWGGRLGRIIVSMKILSEEDIVQALSRQLAIPITDFQSLEVPLWVTQKVDMAFARANSLCPERLSADGKSLVVAMSDPINVFAIDEIIHRTGLRVKTTIAGERAIERAIGMAYGEAFSESSEASFSNVYLNNQGHTHNGLSPLSRQNREETVAQGQTEMSWETVDPATALQVMVDLLIEKGVFTQQEYLVHLGKN
ncbi:MAG: hypothetical protein VYC39_17720 [Myxococcota bacterium]|nr:hypothetical protein [Myxococcota bacterium]